MQNKTVIITGATDGIGKVMALECAKQKAIVWMVGRNAEKTKTCCTEIKKLSKNENVSFIICDLADQKQIRALAEKLLANCPIIDVLINNAGIATQQLEFTDDGIEKTFAVNHLAPFLLTYLLIERIQQSEQGRIITTSSNSHYQSIVPNTGEPGVNFEDLYFTKNFKGYRYAYTQSKACNVLFTLELARKLKDTKITVNAFHPGVVRTGIGNKYGNRFISAMWSFAGLFFLSAQKGAETGIYLAASKEVEGISGKYWVKKKMVWPKRFTQEEPIAKHLWEVSEKLCGITFL